MTTRDTLIVALVALVPGGTAGAQTAGSPAGRLEVSIGVGLLGGAQLGEQPADLRAGGSGDPFRLFNSESELLRSGLVDVRAGVRMSPRYTLEARVALSRPDLRTTISSDLEVPTVDPLVERVKQYAFDGGVRVALGDSIVGLTPFVSAGAGYLRQLHENNTLVDESRYIYAGGGLARWVFVRRGGMLRAAGVRADARVYFFSGGDSLGEDGRRQGAISGSFVVAF